MDWQPPNGSVGGFPSDKAAIPPEKNIISRAVSLFRSRTGYEEGLKITVAKRIPLGGGLGGGSSDAAAVLLALNHLASEGKGLVSDAALAEMGASLGSDVPFFLRAATGAAWINGRGEIVQPVELPESTRNLSIVLVNPGFSSDTAEAYRLFDCMRGVHTQEPASRGSFRALKKGMYSETNTLPKQHTPSLQGGVVDLWRGKNPPILPQDSASLLQSLSSPPQNWPFFNDFFTVFKAAAGESPSMSEIFTIYQHIISDLREQGADFAGLSGSGSTCFGVFSGQEKAELVRESLSLYWPFVISTFLLAHPATPWYN
jgi:4-diphosphocytidyl-2-C-methyl-D-erythritol kinase